MRSHENVILESLNDPPRDVTGGGASPEDLYKEIFERIIEHFERDMPFLSGNLVIDDLVKVVFANKLYISRAISRCAGRNFCQFVNYYRVKHSVDIFRKNPELKVAELSSLSGFNSVGSFTMAFKLYMNENPSDWMRQERNRIIKYRA
jgi:AraC-like DNA-binding protein